MSLAIFACFLDFWPVFKKTGKMAKNLQRDADFFAFFFSGWLQKGQVFGGGILDPCSILGQNGSILSLVDSAPVNLLKARGSERLEPGVAGSAIACRKGVPQENLIFLAGADLVQNLHPEVLWPARII